MTSTATPSMADVGREQLRVPPTRRRMHLPTVLLGVLLVAGCALGFGVLAQHLTDQRAVLVLARPLERGAVLTDADLAVAQLSADAAVRTVAPDDNGQLLGNTLLTALPEGSLLTPDLVAPGTVDLGPDARTVGLALDPGEYPIASLRAGDTVSVVAAVQGGTVLDDDAIVLAVEPAVEGSATLLVSVVVDVDMAAPITAAAAADQVRLVLRGAGR